MTDHAHGEPQPSIASSNETARLHLRFDDTEDFDDARRGRLGGLSEGVIRVTDGRVVWDTDAYEFLDGDCPPSVHPSLWRQSQLTRSTASSR